MPLEGSIHDFGLSDIIQFLRQQNKTGLLLIESSQGSLRIAFENGRIVSADTVKTQKKTWIGEHLVQSERLTADQLQEALKDRTLTSLSESSYVDAGLIEVEQLKQLNILKTKENLFTLFKMSEGNYRFDPAAVDYNPEFVEHLEVDNILLEAVQQIDEWPALESKIPRSSIVFEQDQFAQEKVEVVDEVERAFSDVKSTEPSNGNLIPVSPQEMAILQLIDGKRSVKKIVAMSEIGTFNTYQAIATLMGIKIITQKEGVEVAEEVSSKVPALDLPVREEAPQPVEAKSERRAPALSSLRKMGKADIAVLLLCVVWLAVGAKGVQKSFRFPVLATGFIKHEKIYQAGLDLKEMGVTYYLQTGKFPNTVDEVRQVIPQAEGIEEDLEDWGVRFRGAMERVLLEQVEGDKS